MQTNDRIKFFLGSTLNFGMDNHHEEKGFCPTRHLQLSAMALDEIKI